jgi:hypothetical protein
MDGRTIMSSELSGFGFYNGFRIVQCSRGFHLCYACAQTGGEHGRAA